MQKRIRLFLRPLLDGSGSLPLLAVLASGFSVALSVQGLQGLLMTVIILPPLLLAASAYRSQVFRSDRLTGLVLRDVLVDILDHSLWSSARQARATGALVIEIDQFKALEANLPRSDLETILKTSSDRLLNVLRDADVAARLDGSMFAVALSPARRLDLEAAIQLSTRIQHALSEPIQIGGANTYLTASVGFCLGDRISAPTGETVLAAATSALIEAQQYSPGAVRSFSEAMRQRIVGRSELTEQVGAAMEKGEIKAYYQPQVSTRTGAITGFETLARWIHPDRGLIPPVEFLPALERAGLMDQLCRIMIRDALDALVRWDRLGFQIAQIGVNFSSAELRDPCLVARLAEALKSRSLDPDRLVVEVLETVVANHADDIILRNLSGLAALGCKLDLDDFGTGHASITSIRRYSIERIKIDRSFITRIDADAEQQKMVAAILLMAERLGLDTLAEGVETLAEQKMLADLGCGHVQGFGIARPMPLDDAESWIRNQHFKQHGTIPFRRLVG